MKHADSLCFKRVQLVNVSRPKTDTTAIIDASLAILLCKAGLHKVLVEMYNVVMPGSVYTEITANPYPGADRYQQLLASDKITLQEPLSDIQNEQSRPEQS